MIKYILYYWAKVPRFVKRQIELYRFLRDIEDYNNLYEKYLKANITIYHARCELGAEGWIKVLERIDRAPRLSDVLQNFEDDDS